jgi:CHAT domain-containing protein
MKNKRESPRRSGTWKLTTTVLFLVARPNDLKIVEPDYSVRVENSRVLVLGARSAVLSRAGFRGDCLVQRAQADESRNTFPSSMRRLRARIANHRLASGLLIVVVVAILPLVSRTCILPHRTQAAPFALPVTDLLRDSAASGNPEMLLAEANRLAWLSNWPRAGPIYARAEELFTTGGDTRNAIYARVGRIRAQAQTMSPMVVSEMLSQVLKNPVVKKDPKLKLWCLASKGYTDLDISVPSSKLAWTEALRIAKQLGETGWERRATAELGIIAFLEGNLQSAGHMVGKALLSEMASGDVGGQVRSLEKLGDGFVEVNRNAEASAFFEHAIELTTTTVDAGFPFTAYEGRARILIRQGKLAEAQPYLDRALTVAKNGEMRMDEIQVLILLGERAMQAGDRQAAINHLEEAGALAHKYQWFYMVSQAMFDLTTVYRESGDLQSSEERAASAVSADRQLNSRYYLPRDLTVLADVKALRGDAAGADRLYQQAEDIVDEIQNNNSARPYWASSVAEAMSDIYLHHFKLCVQRGELERALGVIERIRGRTAAVALEKGTGFRSDETAEARILEAKISELQLQLVHSDDSTDRTKLRERLIEYERRLEWTGPAEIVRRGRSGISAPIQQVQSVLRSDELLLEYALDEPRAYCVWISKKAAGIQRLPAGRQSIEKLTAKYLSEIRAKGNTMEGARQLSGILLEPVAPEATSARLIIVPDGILHLLPFDTLRNSSGDLLVETKTIGYVPAATILYILRNRKSFDARRPFLGVGDVAYENQGSVSAKLQKPEGFRNRIAREFSDLFGTPLYDLPETRVEVLEISKIVGKDATLLLGREATETAFKSEPLADFKIIHLAVHGFADNQFPERSGLVLGVDPASPDDGLLQLREIIQLRFHADLVTLAACNTGVGKLQGEEGITNLVEAFLVSGAKAVVASLWTADDTYTTNLMERFYTHIAEGQDKASALRQAKIDLLHRYGKQMPPYYWAAFVLVGDGALPISLGVQ